MTSKNGTHFSEIITMQCAGSKVLIVKSTCGISAFGLHMFNMITNVIASSTLVFPSPLRATITVSCSWKSISKSRKRRKLFNLRRFKRIETSVEKYSESFTHPTAGCRNAWFTRNNLQESISYYSITALFICKTTNGYPCNRYYEYFLILRQISVKAQYHLSHP